MTFKQKRQRALELWAAGENTADIAECLSLPEQFICNFIEEDRENRKAASSHEPLPEEREG